MNVNDYKELYDVAKKEDAGQLDGNVNTRKASYSMNLEQFPKLDTLLERMASVQLVRTESNLISTKETLLKLKEADPEMFYILGFIGLYPRRSELVENANRWCRFVPPLMSAHKELNNVQYEEWDKTDGAIGYAMGITLWRDIKSFLKPIPGLDDNLKELRKPNFFVKSTGARRTTLTGNSWAAMNYRGGNIPGRSLSLQIKCQFGPCNVKIRNEYMILNTINWDNMPKAFDDPDLINKVVSDDITYL